MIFDTQHSRMRHPGSTASEAAEAGYLDPITSTLMCKDCMQSFKLLALKLRPWCGHLVIYRQGFGDLLYEDSTSSFETEAVVTSAVTQ